MLKDKKGNVRKKCHTIEDIIDYFEWTAWKKDARPIDKALELACGIWASSKDLYEVDRALMSHLFRKGYDEKTTDLLALVRIARAVSGKFKFIKFDSPNPTSPALLLRSNKNERLTLQYNRNGEIEAVITKGLV